MTIAEMKADLADLKQKVASLFASKPNAEQLEAAKSDWDDRIDAADARVREMEAAHAEALAAKDAEVASLTEQLATQKTSFEARIAETEGSVAIKAAAKATTIAAAQGIPPGKAPPASNDQITSGSLMEQYAAITDPVKKREFLAKHKVQLAKAARNADRNQ